MYIFLDIDGVLNKQSDWKQPYTINQQNLKIFGETFREIHPIIILISTWKNGFISPGNENNSPQIIELEQKLSVYGLRITGKINGSNRENGIAIFLKEHPGEYIILDDDISEYPIFIKNLHRVDFRTGLVEKDRKKILKEIKI